jgi:hypothetical protein
MAPDPWTSFLDWLSTVLVPSWGELIALLPYVAVATLVGPILTIIVLMWGWHLLRRRRGRVQRAEPGAKPALIAADGTAEFPVNVPYCEEHALIYPPRARWCDIDRADLKVKCPVDGTIRVADIDVCSACGTRFTLGANAKALVVITSDGPPEGGAAIA